MWNQVGCIRQRWGRVYLKVKKEQLFIALIKIATDFVVFIRFQLFWTTRSVWQLFYIQLLCNMKHGSVPSTCTECQAAKHPSPAILYVPFVSSFQSVFVSHKQIWKFPESQQALVHTAAVDSFMFTVGLHPVASVSTAARSLLVALRDGSGVNHESFSFSTTRAQRKRAKPARRQRERQRRGWWHSVESENWAAGRNCIEKSAIDRLSQSRLQNWAQHRPSAGVRSGGIVCEKACRFVVHSFESLKWK